MYNEAMEEMLEAYVDSCTVEEAAALKAAREACPGGHDTYDIGHKCPVAAAWDALQEARYNARKALLAKVARDPVVVAKGA